MLTKSPIHRCSLVNVKILVSMRVAAAERSQRYAEHSTVGSLVTIDTQIEGIDNSADRKIDR